VLGPAATPIFTIGTLAATFLAVACSARQSPPHDEARVVAVHREGESTFVSISEGDMVEPVNTRCLSYCERLASCWYALPGADVRVREDDVRTRCKEERQDCRIPTTDELCCTQITDCGDFARCQSESRDLAMDCTRMSRLSRD
jgi:hypothetical protein